MRTDIEAQRLIRIQRELEKERIAAKPIVARLRTTIHERWDSEVPSQWRTAGFVEELTGAARELLEKDARAAQALAQYAVVIVTSIPERSYPSPILTIREAEAWNELASAHRYLSQYDAALRALDAADRRLYDVPSVSWHRAVVRLSRALVLCDTNRLEEAEVLTTECIEVFEQCQDTNRSAHAVLLQGMIRHRSDRLAAAAESYRHSIVLFKRTRDLAGLGSAYNNLGHAQAALGQTSDAVTSLHDALSIFVDLDFAGEAARTRCILASILMRAGELHQARELYAAARGVFARSGMVEEAGIAGLGLVDVFLGLNETTQARLLTEQVLAEFRAANLAGRALVALRYLHDMMLTPRAQEAARHVRQFIETFKADPLRAFAPLPERPLE